jgi:hypothetical protein
MKGERIDKNVPFYMGFYKYKDTGTVLPTPNSKSGNISKTLNSLDFASLLNRRNSLRRNSNPRQIQTQNNKVFFNCHRGSDAYDPSEKRTPRSSVDVGRRSCITSKNITGRTSVIGSRTNLLGGCRMESHTFRVSDVMLGSESVLDEQQKLQSRRFFYCSNEPGYKSEVVNQRVSASKMQIGHPNPTANQLTRVSSNNNLAETLAGSRTSMHFSSNQKRANFSSTAIVDSETISFNRLIRTSSKKNAYLNCTPTIDEFVKDTIDDTPNMTAIDIETSIMRKTHRTNEHRFSALSSAKKDVPFVKLTTYIRRLATCFDKLMVRKSMEYIKSFGNSVCISRKLSQIVQPSVCRTLAVAFRLVRLKARSHRAFHSAFIRLNRIVRAKKTQNFRLLKISNVLAKLHCVFSNRKLAYSHSVLRTLKVLTLVGRLARLKQRQLFTSFQKLRFHDPVARPKTFSLRTSASFLLQLSHLLDNDYRGVKDFFRLIKRRAFAMKSLEIQLERKARVLASQAQLALRKLRIFARFKKVQSRNLLLKRYA